MTELHTYTPLRGMAHFTFTVSFMESFCAAVIA